MQVCRHSHKVAQPQIGPVHCSPAVRCSRLARRRGCIAPQAAGDGTFGSISGPISLSTELAGVLYPLGLQMSQLRQLLR